MKATNTITNNILKSLILIAAIFFFQVLSVKAEGNYPVPSPSFTMNNLITILAPTAPSLTDFSDAELNAADFTSLAPVVPSEADFNDTPETNANVADLAPLTPSEADFSDAELLHTDITSLAPVTTSFADFND
ncbi:MAG: hypothetical protein NTW31_08360 [Bacteroidetes bacterium]|nr:hypothetical protein [Bacteroidota bacterium]